MRRSFTTLPWVIVSIFFQFLLWQMGLGQDNVLVSTLNLSINEGNHDAEERPDGSMYLNSTDLELTEDGDGPQLIGLHFENVLIPQGAAILAAYLQFTTDEVGSRTTELAIYTETEDDARAFTANDRDLSQRNLSQSAVDWKPSAWNVEEESGPEQQSPDLTQILKEVIDRPGWQAGNAMVFLIKGTGRRTAIAFERNPSLAAKLIIEIEIPLANTQIEGLFINELMASNGIYQDEFGEADDWVEIYNGSDVPVNLGGLYVTDRLDDLTKWQITSSLLLPPGGFGLIWIDDDEEQGGNHASFNLSKNGEDLALVQVLDGNPIILDQIRFPEINLNVSYGRKQDGQEPWVKFGQASPLASNNDQEELLNAQVQFSLPGGIYSSTINLELQSDVPSSQIYYTLDGSIPNDLDRLYSSPISLDRTTVITAIVVKDERKTQNTFTQSYIVKEQHQLPVLSLQTDPKNLWDKEIGIYVQGTNGVQAFCSGGPRNWNQDWERPVNLSLFEEDGSTAFQVDVGVKIGGGCSRNNKVKSMNFYLRGGTYGDSKIAYPLFPQLALQEYKRFKIRNSGNDYVQMTFRDAANQSVLSNTIDIDLMGYRPAVVYINGAYWGIYGMREFFNEDYIESHHGVDPEDVDIINNPNTGGFSVREGSFDDYADLIEFIENNDLSDPSNYEFVASQIDINEYLNYHISQVYFANYDWPANNVRIWRNREGGKWRWMLFDTDASTNYEAWSMSSSHTNTLELATATDGPSWPNGPRSTLFLRKLLENEEFRAAYVQRTSTYANLFFQADRVARIVDSLKNHLRPEMERYISHWRGRFNDLGNGNPANGSMVDWNRFIENYKTFFRNRAGQARFHIARKFSLQSYILSFQTDKNTRGTVYLHSNEVQIPNGFTASYFRDVPLKIKAVPEPGYVFIKWLETGNTQAEIEYYGEENTTLTPVFAPIHPIITEVHYHPQQGEEFEFIELYNATESDLNIGGYRLSDAISFTFPQGTLLEPGSYIIVAKDRSYYQSLSCQVFEWDSGELENIGDNISLEDPSGKLLDRVSYTNSAPWPYEADGGGPSLSIKSLLLDNSFPENWEPYFANGGSPCGESSPIPDLLGAETFDISIFPVPVSNDLSISYSSLTSEALRVEVINIHGQIMDRFSLESTEFKQTKVMSISHWNDGVYTLRIMNQGNKLWQRIVAKISR